MAEKLSGIAAERGTAAWIRTDNEDLWKSTTLNRWLAENHIRHRLIRHGSPWENGVVESFFAQLRRELLNTARFYNSIDADAQAAAFRDLYNLVRPHGAINWQTPAEYCKKVIETRNSLIGKCSAE